MPMPAVPAIAIAENSSARNTFSMSRCAITCPAVARRSPATTTPPGKVTATIVVPCASSSPARDDAGRVRPAGSDPGEYAPRNSVNDAMSGLANNPGRRPVCDSWDATRLPSLHHGRRLLDYLHRRGRVRPYCSRSPARMPRLPRPSQPTANRGPWTGAPPRSPRTPPPGRLRQGGEDLLQAQVHPRPALTVALRPRLPAVPAVRLSVRLPAAAGTVAGSTSGSVNDSRETPPGREISFTSSP